MYDFISSNFELYKHDTLKFKGFVFIVTKILNIGIHLRMLCSVSAMCNIKNHNEFY